MTARADLPDLMIAADDAAEAAAVARDTYDLWTRCGVTLAAIAGNPAADPDDVAALPAGRRLRAALEASWRSIERAGTSPSAALSAAMRRAELVASLATPWLDGEDVDVTALDRAPRSAVALAVNPAQRGAEGAAVSRRWREDVALVREVARRLGRTLSDAEAAAMLDDIRRGGAAR